mmetsp:Transcript_21057/g.59817  ORF Transcript_21057/g.59817 Transcript_21057/m.59817 type:complete len:281 (-) Transcript_21057:3-845(-)
MVHDRALDFPTDIFRHRVPRARDVRQVGLLAHNLHELVQALQERGRRARGPGWRRGDRGLGGLVARVVVVLVQKFPEFLEFFPLPLLRLLLVVLASVRGRLLLLLVLALGPAGVGSDVVVLGRHVLRGGDEGPHVDQGSAEGRQARAPPQDAEKEVEAGETDGAQRQRLELIRLPQREADVRHAIVGDAGLTDVQRLELPVRHQQLGQRLAPAIPDGAGVAPGIPHDELGPTLLILDLQACFDQRLRRRHRAGARPPASAPSKGGPRSCGEGGRGRFEGA